MNDSLRGPAQGPLLEARGICKTYPDGQVRALDKVDLAIAQGEFVAITGPSGCGKSTFLNILGALDRPDQGELFFRGTSLAQHPSLDAFRARQIGFVFQSFFLLPALTALENIQVPMFEGPIGPIKDRAKKAAQLLDLVGMTHRARHRPSRLSVGERQRVALARSLANDPVLLLADEPTGNLDSANANHVLDLLIRIREERGLTLLMVTHSPEVSQRADRVVRMLDGHVVSQESPAISKKN